MCEGTTSRDSSRYTEDYNERLLADTVRAFARFVSGRIFPRAAYPVLRGPLRGAKFVLGSLAGEGGGASVYFNAVEKEQTASLVATLRPGNVFFDIGANVGYYSLLGARLVGPRGRVVALEPVVRNVAFLHRHVVLNRAGNVTIVPAACSDRIALASFASGDNYATGRLAGGPGDENGVVGTPVPTVTIDALVNALELLPDVIKIDVEGAELDVLRGACETFLRAKPTIYLSVHSATLRTGCLDHLGSLGYAVERLRPDEDEPTEFVAFRRG